MTVLDPSARHLHCSIAYVGPPSAGKRTNIHFLHEATPARLRSAFFSVGVPFPLVGFYFSLPALGRIDGAEVCLHLSAVRGSEIGDEPRRQLLRNVDAIVFVADAQRSGLEANLEHWARMRELLAERPRSVPVVLQYNKCDRPETMPSEELDELLNPDALPRTLAVATEGSGVMATLKTVVKPLMVEIHAGRARRQPLEAAVPDDPLQLWQLFRGDLPEKPSP